MSLKAKLEAVIYAAEEPVTLAQLTTLFAPDALAWKAEQEAEREAEQSDLPLGDDNLPVPSQSLESPEPSAPSEPADSTRELSDLVAAVEETDPAAIPTAPDGEPAPEVDTRVEEEPSPETATETPTADSAPSEPVAADAVDVELEAKRQHVRAGER